MLIVSHFVLRLAHHPHHCYATGPYKVHDEKRGEEQEQDIQNRCVIPLYALCDSDNIAVLRNNSQGGKQEFDDISSGGHRNIECQQDKAHHLPSIVFAIDIQNRQDDEIGKDEADDATEADAIPSKVRSISDTPSHNISERDIDKIVWPLLKGGLTVRAIAERANTSPATVGRSRKWWERQAE